MDATLVERELERSGLGGESGAHAESMLREVGIVAARSH
jgi:hypothetical protein